MNYTVDLSDDAEEDLKGLAPHTKGTVNRVLKRLPNGPDHQDDLRLEGSETLWRARAGRRWRVVYEVHPGRRIEVRRIRRREVVYEGLERPPRDLAESPPAPNPTLGD